jgi:hypothetical protein
LHSRKITLKENKSFVCCGLRRSKSPRFSYIEHTAGQNSQFGISSWFAFDSWDWNRSTNDAASHATAA